MAIEVGAGTTLAFSGGGSTWSTAAKIRSISGLEQTTEVHDITDLSIASNGNNLKAFNQTIDHGPIDIEYFWDYAVDQPPINTTFNITITWETNTTLVGSGRIISRTSGQNVSNEIRMGTIRWQFDGATITWDNNAGS